MRDLVDGKDMNIGGKLVVDPAPQRLRRDVGVQLEMRNLSEGMDTGVRSSGTVQFELTAAGNLANRPIDLPLDGPGVFLDLPPAIPGAGVLDDELETGHDPVTI